MEFKPIELDYYIDDVTKEMQSVYMEFRPLALSLKSGEAFEFNIQRNAENLTEEFEIRDGHVIRAGRYWTNRGEFQFETFEGRPVVAAVGFNWGEFYDGTSTEWEAELAWKPSKHFSARRRLSPGPTSGSPDGAFAIDEVVGRMNLSLNPRLFGSVFAQWNNDENEILFNFRVTWIPKPGATSISSSTSSATRSIRRRWRLNKTVAMLKFVWYFRHKVSGDIFLSGGQ